MLRDLIREAVRGGAGREKACKTLGITARTLQRWEKCEDLKDGRRGPNRVPANKLSKEEYDRILETINTQAYQDMPPAQIVPDLADKGQYIGSPSTIYRIMKKEKMNAHRQASKPAKHKPPKGYTAHGPNQVWTWDITYLPREIRGAHFYLYMFLDIYSRKIVGWEVHEDESAAQAAALVAGSYLKEGLKGDRLVLHSDNGSPMKGATMLATLQRLGVMPSFSRPSVSNDNPFSESLFRTLKYRPEYPEKAFFSIQQARTWVAQFVSWYNGTHRHSALNMVTPNQRHSGEDREILAQRIQVYEMARDQHPERWSGKSRNWSRPGSVHLNRPKGHETVESGKRFSSKTIAKTA